MVVNEKHPDTYQALKKNMREYPNVAVHQRDAYELLPAIVPPFEKRGLVLIDPAFEDPNEMAHVNECLSKCAKRWPQGMYLIWLPIVGRKHYDSRDLTHCGFEKFLTVEFYVRSKSSDVEGLIGCSLLFINPPWQIETTLTPLLTYLWEVLHIDPDSTWSIQI
jgi:23S rRNA (adenine2030-N6)-methyltransferase